MKRRCNFSFLVRFFTFAGTLVLAFSAANAMVTYDPDAAAQAAANGTSYVGTHNTAPTEELTEIWNRTVSFGAGTTTYLGTSPDGRHRLLTAAHMSTQSTDKETNIVYGSTGSITTADNKSISLTAEINDYTVLKNANGTDADLKVFSIDADSIGADESVFLSAYNGINNIEIYTGTLYDSFTIQENTYLANRKDLYAVGTGRNLSIGENISYGGRQKQWGNFYANGNWTDTGGNAVFVESFSNSENHPGIQTGMQDSGSGVFVRDSDEKWKLAGVALAIGTNVRLPSNEDDDTENDIDIKTLPVGYEEDSTTEDSAKVCYTYFADLSQYAGQINEIMSIPEPSAFGFLAGTFALAFVSSRRSRRK